MNTKILWFVAFILAALFSCWATSKSLLLIMPNFLSSNPMIGTIMVWALVLLIFILASMAMKWVVDALRNDCDNRRTMFWGGVLTLIVAWILISLPTNAHTFFYNKQIGAVVTQDIKSTDKYLNQLANRTVTDSSYYELEKKVNERFKQFQDQALIGFSDNGISGHGVGKYANGHIGEINEMLPEGYKINLPNMTNTNLVAIVNNVQLEKDLLLKKLKEDKYCAGEALVKKSRIHIKKLNLMDSAIQHLISVNEISDQSAEKVIFQTEGELQHAYTTIKSGSTYVDFQGNKRDKELYTAENIETATSRFLNPYVVMYDFFTGKHHWTFIFWLLLSLVIDVMGFLFYYQWRKN